MQCLLLPACFAVVSVEFSSARYVAQEGHNLTVGVVSNMDEIPFDIEVSVTVVVKADSSCTRKQWSVSATCYFLLLYIDNTSNYSDFTICVCLQRELTCCYQIKIQQP